MIPVHLFLVLKKNCFKILDILIFCETSSLNTPSVQITFQTIFNRNRLFKQHDPILYQLYGCCNTMVLFQICSFPDFLLNFQLTATNCGMVWYGVLYYDNQLTQLE